MLRVFATPFIRIFGALALVAGLQISVRAATVTSNADSGPGTLRDAIANAAPGATITFAANVASPIVLGSDIEIESNITIVGPGTTALAISGDAATRFFTIGLENSSAKVTISKLTFQSGRTPQFDAEGPIYSDGGAIANFGVLTLNEVVFSSNTTYVRISEGSPNGNNFARGGAILNAGTLTTNDCTFDGNSAQTQTDGSESSNYSLGGAIYNSGTANINTSTFKNNSSSGENGPSSSSYNYGGAIYNEEGGTLLVYASTFNNNLIGGTLDSGGFAQWFGGAVCSFGVAKLTNSTISGNSIDESTQENGEVDREGGGVYTPYGEVVLRARAASDGPSFTVVGTICAGNQCQGSPDFSGLYISGGNNLVGIQSGSSGFSNGDNADQVGNGEVPLDPLLSQLSDLGGKTPTMALLPGSPAINAGYNSAGFDQRGVAYSGQADIGAFESTGFALTIDSGTPQSAPVNAPFELPLRALVTETAFNKGVPGIEVDFEAPSSSGPTASFFGPSLQAQIKPRAEGPIIPGIGFPVTTDSSGLAYAYVYAGNIAGSYAITTKSLNLTPVLFQLTNLPAGGGGAIVPNIDVFYTDDNPAMIGQTVTYFLAASDADSTQLSYQINFGDDTGIVSGNFSPLAVYPVTHVYNGSGEFMVTVTISDESNHTASTTVPQTVLAPASPAVGVKNISDNTDTVISPIDGLKVAVTASNGGIIQLTIDIDSLTRAAYGVSTDWGDFAGRTATVAGIKPTHKYTAHGLFVATVKATNLATKKAAAKMRKTLAISSRETAK